MNRKEKLDVLDAIKRGVPIGLALIREPRIYLATSEPGKYYNEAGELIDIDRYKQHCNRVQYMEAPTPEMMFEIIKITQKLSAREYSNGRNKL